MKKQQSVLEISGMVKRMISLKVDNCSQADSYTEENITRINLLQRPGRGDVIQYNKVLTVMCIHTGCCLILIRDITIGLLWVNQDGEENAVTSNDTLDTLFGHVQHTICSLWLKQLSQMKNSGTDRIRRQI